ncbi:circadian clock KaiB family protein [Amorphus orientalis]|uniref:KaiB domain-containing protein n=1 Tax=Amorphus orientalis TaxID=649198 RepID=A0AAE3VLZ0_9HYPH|nr:circadian clock KaiB family protein [Amorphus orientalis]MDQ0314569.1 hypothetical protein [Amorphus orientalis]
MSGTPRLRLFVTADSPGSLAARRNLETIMEAIGIGMGEVEIVDVLKNPAAALEADVIVTPALEIVRNDRRLLIAGRLDDMDAVRARLE